MRKKLLRLLWVAPVAMLVLAGSAAAQTTGNIVGVVNDAATGKPVAGALVIATSKALQGEQTAVTDGKGAYTLSALPPGIYKVSAQLQGYKPAERGDLNLRVDYTLRVNIAIVPEAVQMEEQVVRTATAPAVNVGSAEAGTIVTREFLANVPGTRTFEQVSTVAPTAQNDGFGVSFAGGTSPENNYIIDGLRVADPSVGTNATNLLTNFIDQLDVKVGSFMPEYGYSSAGIINAVTKSGGNEFHGSIWGNITPGFFSPSTPAVSQAGEAIASQSVPYRGSYDTDFGVEVGGPIVKDKLWFYAGFAPRLQYNASQKYYQSRTACPPGTPASRCVDGWLLDSFGNFVMAPIAGTETSYGTGYTKYFALAKLTWLVSENHNITASFNTQPTTTSTMGFLGSDLANQGGNSDNTTNVTLSWTGKFLDKHLLAEVRGGWFGYNYDTTASTVGGYNNLQVNRIVWQDTLPLSTFVSGVPCADGACVVSLYRTGGRGYGETQSQNRYAGSASLTGLFEAAGQHQLKGGVQLDYSNFNDNLYTTGGAYFYAYGDPNRVTADDPRNANRFAIYRSYGGIDPNNMIQRTTGAVNRSQNICSSVTVNADGSKTCNNIGQGVVTNPGHNDSSTNTWSNGFFLQDSWTIANVLTLNFGVRLDQQKMTNATYAALDPEAQQLFIGDMWAPRVQAIWDFTGTGRGKIQGNWGMYYESIPLDMASRAFGTEVSINGSFQMSSCPTRDPLANPGMNVIASCPNVYGLEAGQGPGPNTVPLLVNPATGGRYSYTQRGFGLGSPYSSPIQPNLKGQYTQQFGGGIQYEILQDLTVGVDYLGRRLGTIVEDMSSDDGANYYIANPATGKAWTVTSGAYEGLTLNPQQVAGGSVTLGQYYATTFPKAERNYDAFTFTVNKLFSKRWLAQASYTWSSLRGNYNGLLRTEDDQLDPNLSADYDLVSLLGNKTGPLGLNRTNQIKLAGSYNASLSSDVTFVPSLNFQALSGVPVNAFAAHSGPVQSYGPGSSFVLPRGSGGVLDWTWQVDVGAKVVWAISGPYTLQFSLDIFNLLNLATPQWVDNNYTFDNATPINGAYCSGRSNTITKDPINAIQASCPDLPYARTPDGRPLSVNLNYGQPQGSSGGRVGAYQLPISARFGVQLSF